MMMKSKLTQMLTNLFLVVGVLLLASAGVLAQGAPVKSNPAKPVAFSTAPKLVVAKLKNGEADVYDIRGKLTFTVTAANSDDTVVGTINYTIPDDARQKIAEVSGKPLAQVPANFQQKNVVAKFQKATEYPVIHLETDPMDVSILGAKTHFNRIVIDINGRQSEDSRYTNAEMEALFTVWARQILNGRSRRGPIARMNRVINGEEDQ